MDTVKVGTTQNINLHLDLAGVFQRILAFSLDLILMVAFTLLTFLIFVQVTSIWSGMFMLVLDSIIWFVYFLVSEITMNGQTFGKRIMKIRVVKLDGTAPTWSAYLLRWVFAPIDYSLGGSIAIILITFTKKGQRLGDIVAGTTVVKVAKATTQIQRSREVLHGMGDDYVPVFPEATKLSNEDMKLIKAAIAAFEKGWNTKPAELLKAKLLEKMQRESDQPALKFLQQVYQDFHYLSLQEKAPTL